MTKLALITLLFGSILSVQIAAAATAQTAATILPYQNSSFAPVRGESFSMTVSIADPKNIKQAVIEIRTSDDDLIQTLTTTLQPDKTRYEIVWDGKDSQHQVVPDEAYHPVLILTDHNNHIERLDGRLHSGGEEVYDFEKNTRPGVIEYTLPVASRVLIRSGIKNGPLLRTIIDWVPRTAGFHAERWNGRDKDDLIAMEQNPQIGYLIVGYQLPDHSMITYGNHRETYRAYRERRQWPLKQAGMTNKRLEREGKVIRTEYYTPLLQQKSPRITVNLLDRSSRKAITHIQGYDELITEVKLHPLDELYLDQQRYEISFFIDNEFIAEEEQGFVPYTWRWSPGRFGLKPGHHVLTVNVSGYRGQVGVKNRAFTLEADQVLPDRSTSGSDKATKLKKE